MENFMGSIYRRVGKAEENGTSPGAGHGEGEPREIMKRLDDASCSGKIKGTCGETMEIYLKVEGETITDTSFITDGCRFSKICGYVATRLALEKTLDDAVRIGGDTILEVLEGIPKEETHCAYLAAETLQAAIHEWMLNNRPIT